MLFEVLPDPRPLIAPGEADESPVLQFHREIPERVPIGHFESGGREVVDEIVSRADYLDWIQQACAVRGERLEIRFYDHFDTEFDASVLDSLSEIRQLSIGRVPSLRNAEAIGRLPKLTSLNFGPVRAGRAGVLSSLGVGRLTHFTLAGSPTPTVDLAPLADARSLRSLRLLGRGKNTHAIAHATSLVELAIEPSTKFSLECVNRLVSLESLKFVLGQSQSIRAVETLPQLRDLSFHMVRLLEDLGDLERFPRLRRLQLSDQPKVSEVLVGPRNVALEHLYLYSVPALLAVKGFDRLPVVKSLFAYDSRLDLLHSGLPPTLTHFQLLTKAIKGREAHDALVRAKELIAGVHADATFFYK